MKKIFIGVVILAAVFAAAFFYFNSRQPEKIVAKVLPIAASTPAGVENTSYIIDGTPVALVNGAAQAQIASGTAEMQTTRYLGYQSNADLTGAGRLDYVFILTQDTGGSGLFYYLAVALATDQGFQGTNTVFLGDRIIPLSTAIHNGLITVNYTDRNPGDPFTAAPSAAVSRNFRIIDGSLAEIK